MLLAVDIGNTNIVFGCADEDDRIVFFERISTNQNATTAEYAVLIKTLLEMNGYKVDDVSDAILSSVVPSVTTTVVQAIKKLFHTDVMIAGPGVRRVSTSLSTILHSSEAIRLLTLLLLSTNTPFRLSLSTWERLRRFP